MSQKQDVRWIQRFSNYEKALDELKKEVSDSFVTEYSRLEKKGIIQSFEIVYELAWNVIKDFFSFIGNNEIYGSKDAFREAFKANLIQNGEIFMNSIKSRNMISHVYDEEISNEIFYAIVNDYYKAFEELRENLVKQKKQRGL